MNLLKFFRIKTKSLLFIDCDIPAFDKNAGYFITFEYLKVFRDLGYKIYFWYHNERFREYAAYLEKLGIYVKKQNQDFEAFIKKEGRKLDLAVISRPDIAKHYFPLVKKFSNAKIYYLPQDLHYLRELRTATIKKDQEKEKHAEATKDLEISIMRQSRSSLFFSEREVELVKKYDNRIQADVIPWIQPALMNWSDVVLDGRTDLLFLGGFIHEPNVDAVLWFHANIFPIIKEQLPQIKAIILGSNPPQQILDLNTNDFKIEGFVTEDDLSKYFNNAKIFLSPLRYGAGFKGKIARSMAFGLPVVTTNVGAEGIGLINGENALIADNPEEFAKQVINLYSDNDLWKKISKNSIIHIENNYSTKNAKEKILNILNRN